MTYDQKPWVKSYDPGVLPEIEIPDISLKDYFVDTLIAMSEKPALSFMGMEMSFGDLLEKSGRFAKGLQKKGFGKGDVVAICLPNIPQYLIAVVGALRAGCAVTGLAPLLMPDEMVYQLNNSGAGALVILDGLFDAKYSVVADQTPKVSMVLVTGATDIFTETKEYPAGKPLDCKTVMPFMNFLLSQHSAEPDVVYMKPTDPCYIQYTGGTTGSPKGAVLTHHNMVSNIAVFKHYMQFESGQGAWITAFPMFHMAGLFVSTCAMAYGYCQGLLPDPRNMEAVVKTIDRLKPFLIANVPSLAFMLMNEEAFKKLDFSNLRYWLSGASPFPVEEIKKLEKIIGQGKVVEVWGMTETSPLITVNPAKGEKVIGSVGLPLPNTEFKVVDIDGETEMPIGSEGELIASGPQVMQGYLNRPKETANALREHDGRIFMHTGDVGRMDENGYVYLVDRVKDMIVVGGWKVFSSEVEDKFYDHPAVGMCALIGVSNPNRPDSEIVKLFVQKSEAYKDKPDEDVETELIAFAKEKMAPYKVPKIIEFMEALPMTSVGKLNKKMLRD